MSVDQLLAQAMDACAISDQAPDRAVRKRAQGAAGADSQSCKRREGIVVHAHARPTQHVAVWQAVQDAAAAGLFAEVPRLLACHPPYRDTNSWVASTSDCGCMLEDAIGAVAAPPLTDPSGHRAAAVRAIVASVGHCHTLVMLMDETIVPRSGADPDACPARWAVSAGAVCPKTALFDWMSTDGFEPITPAMSARLAALGVELTQADAACLLMCHPVMGKPEDGEYRWLWPHVAAMLRHLCPPGTARFVAERVEDAVGMRQIQQWTLWRPALCCRASTDAPWSPSRPDNANPEELANLARMLRTYSDAA